MYAEVAPPAAMAHAVACLWMRRSDAGDKPTLVLPDGCFDLIWRPGDEVLLAAPDTVASRVPATAASVWVGLRFRPGVGKAVLGTPMDALLNERPTVTDVLTDGARGAGGRASRDLLARTSQAATAEEAAALLARLGEVLTGQAAIDREVALASRLLADQRRTVASVAAEVSVPERSLSRRLTEQVGYGPKMLQRVLRLQRLLSISDAGAARGDRIPLADLAAAAGYADQSHLVRDAVALTGLTPSALLAAR